jgi:ribonuclease P protein component
LNLKNTFTKDERISRQKEIDCLFSGGSSFVAYPLRVVYVKQKPVSGAEAAVLISVPKRNFKRAVKRNRIKRLIRESYRLNKTLLTSAFAGKETGLLVAFLYIGKEVCGYNVIETAIKEALKKLAQLEDLS